MKTLLWDFNAILWRVDILKPTIKNENLHDINNENGMRVKKKLSRVQCCHIATQIQSDFSLWENSQPDQFLTNNRRHSSVFDV